MTTTEKVADECLVLLNTDPDASDLYAYEAAKRIDALIAEDRRELVWLVEHLPAHPGTSIAEWDAWERRKAAALAKEGSTP